MRGIQLLRHRKFSTSFNFLVRLISENFLLRSRVSHAHVTQRVSSHSDKRTSSFTELCTSENHVLTCTLRCMLCSCVVNLNGFAICVLNPQSITDSDLSMKVLTFAKNDNNYGNLSYDQKC